MEEQVTDLTPAAMELLRKNLRVCGDLPLDFTKVTHGKLHLDSLAALDAERKRSSNLLIAGQQLYDALDQQGNQRAEAVEAWEELTSENETSNERIAREDYEEEVSLHGKERIDKLADAARKVDDEEEKN